MLPTSAATVAVDRQGGIHAAYAIYAGAEGARQPAIYAYCPANPGNPSNWTFTRVGEAVQDARLALDPEGRPRLLLFGPVDDPETPFRTQYRYAECNSGWTNASNWSLTTIVTPIEAVATREENNNRYFEDITAARVSFPASSALPRVSIRRVGSRLEMASEEGVLESAERVDGPWSTLEGVTSPWLVAPEDMRRFYRVRQ